MLLATIMVLLPSCCQVFCKALIGVPLKDSEFLKLEQTHLADIIAEEAGNEHFREEVCGDQNSVANLS